jgi:hypothetical protein
LLGQQPERLWTNLKPAPHALREDDRRCAMLEEFGHVSGLDAGLVRGSGFAPVPFACSAGKDLNVLEGAEPIDLNSSPCK